MRRSAAVCGSGRRVPDTRLGPDASTAKLDERGMGGVRSTLVASCLVVLLLLASTTAAQVVEGATAAQGDAGAGSITSLQRIRRALAVTPPAGVLNLHEFVHVVAEAPEAWTNPSLLGDFDVFSGPVPFGPPTRYDMHGLTPPVGALYSHRVSTAVLAPFTWAGKAIVGLFTGDEEPAPAVQSVLSRAGREQALAQIQGHPTVLAATIEQRGRTVALALVVPASTPVATARQLGDDFVRMVTTLAPTTPAPGADSNAGDYDYIIGVRTPTDVEITVGGKPSASRRISW